VATTSVEDEALTDPRFRVLGLALGAPTDGEAAQALGLYYAILVWRYCRNRSSYVVSGDVIEAIKTGLGEAMARAGLASQKRDGWRVHGTKGRIEWLKKLRESNRTRQQRKRQRNALVTRDNPGPSASASASSQELQKDPPTPQRAPRAVVAYTDGFLRAWGTYPHFEQRSRKREAFDVWRRLQLDPLADAVVAWIEAGRRSADWTRDGGSIVPGFQVWLKGREFGDPPPLAGPAIEKRPVLAWETPNRLLTPEEREARRRRDAGQGATA
jgi:hypothetical protein